MADTMVEKILTALKKKGPMDENDIMREIKNRSRYVTNTLSTMRRSGVITKVNDKYTHLTEDEIFQIVPTEREHVSSHLPIPQDPLVYYCQDPSVKITMEKEVLEKFYPRAVLGLKLYAILVSVLGNKRGKQWDDMPPYDQDSVEAEIAALIREYGE